MIVETFPVGMLGCNCTVLGDPATDLELLLHNRRDAGA